MKKYLFSVVQFVQLFVLSAILALFTSQASAISAPVEEYEITAKKLNHSRNKLSPSVGASSFSFKKEDIDNLPLGEATPINQLLLRAPGVAQDSFGQIHVRGDHSNVQYRINGIMLPKAIGSFGQMFDTRFAESVDFLTGALPAQYGYRTAGVVDIKTKDGAFKKGGRSEVMVGSYDTVSTAQEVSGSSGKLNYYINGSYLQNNRGIENPTSARNAQHNDAQQDRLFGYFSYFVDAQTKLSLIVANSTNRFELPNNPNQQAAYNLNGANNINSATLDANQKESNRYTIIALQGVSDLEIDYQISAFVRQSQVSFNDDYAGGLVFNGVASSIDRNSVASGLQGDFSYALNEKNILRSGFFVSDDFVKNRSNNAVFATNDDGEQLDNNPRHIVDHQRKRAQNYGIYLQNEYHPTKKLTLNYGGRFEASQSYKNESQLSPRVGAVYDLTQKTKLHAGFARYFTPPQNELISQSTLTNYQNTSNAPNSLTNDPVRAERSNYYDIGVKHKLNERTNIGFDTYYKDVQNLLDEGQFGNAIIYSPLNFQRARIFGAEITADYRQNNFSGYVNLATSRAKAQNVVSNQYLLDDEEIRGAKRYVNVDHEQRFNASAGVAYLFKQTRYSADMIYGSGLSKDLYNHLPPYTVFNIAAAHDFELPIIQKFNLRFTMLNLFDKEYKLRDGSGIGVGAPQYGARRAAYLTFSKAF
ncbi:MAG: TonB-dependent receptor [Rickettsiales bacterium]|nr:TonB-dependent receptor [Rickettsiales bacterium]